jgi:hypothetical protein
VKIITKNCCSSTKSPLLSQPPVHSLITMNVPAPSNSLTTSKSENNIFDKNNLALPFGPTYDVVSLSDLSDDSNFQDHHQMNDLSRTRVLNKLSENKINVPSDRI